MMHQCVNVLGQAEACRQQCGQQDEGDRSAVHVHRIVERSRFQSTAKSRESVRLGRSGGFHRGFVVRRVRFNRDGRDVQLSFDG